MSGLDWDAWIERSPSLARITPAALYHELAGFPLEAKQGTEWLARAIQGSLCLTFRFLPETSYITGERVVIRVPNATDAKQSYGKLAKAADDLLQGIARNSELLAYSLSNPERYAEIYNQVKEIAALFAGAAAEAKPCRRGHRLKRAREDRVQMAAALAPVFEMAFDKPATVDNRDNWQARYSGSWPDFFERISFLVVGDKQKRDYWRDVCKEARSINLLRGVTFAPGQLPK